MAYNICIVGISNSAASGITLIQILASLPLVQAMEHPCASSENPVNGCERPVKAMSARYWQTWTQPAANPFRYCNSSTAVIRLVVMMSVRFSFSPLNVEDMLFERGSDICRETMRLRRCYEDACSSGDAGVGRWATTATSFSDDDSAMRHFRQIKAL